MNNANSLGIYDNFFWGNHLEEYTIPEERAEYLSGRIQGDAISIALGLGSAEIGTGVAAAGLSTVLGAIVFQVGALHLQHME